MKNKNNSLIRTLPAILIAMSVLLAAFTCAKAVIFSKQKKNISNDVTRALNTADVNSNAIKEFLANYSDAAAKLKNKNLFSPTGEKKSNLVIRVDGIMGSSARINDKWYEVGESIGQAKLVSVSFTDVTILLDGKETKYSPINAATTYAVKENSQPAKGKPAVTTKPAEQKSNVEHPKKPPVAQAVQEDPLAWAGVKMSPQLRAKILEKWNQMSDKEKAETKKGWESMSPDQRQRMVDRMETMKDRM